MNKSISGMIQFTQCGIWIDGLLIEDVSTLEIGKTYTISYEYRGAIIIIHKAIITEIDINQQEFTFETVAETNSGDIFSVEIL